MTRVGRIDVFNYFIPLRCPGNIKHYTLNIVGYIPVIGTISGIARVKLAQAKLKDLKAESDDRRPFLRAYLFRGVVEIFSIGALFILPDLIVTIGKIFASVIFGQI